MVDYRVWAMLDLETMRNGVCDEARFDGLCNGLDLSSLLGRPHACAELWAYMSDDVLDLRSHDGHTKISG